MTQLLLPPKPEFGLPTAPLVQQLPVCSLESSDERLPIGRPAVQLPVTPKCQHLAT
jgi:hypothetical protein